MPPKKGSRAPRKVDPEVQARQFEEWKETEQYKQWGEILKIKADRPEYSQTTDDLFNDVEYVAVTWQEYLNALWDFGKIQMKMKFIGKLKGFIHELFRSFTFVREDKKDYEKDGHHVPLIDGVNCGCAKEFFDEAWHIRKKLEEIHKYLDEYPDLTDQNYSASKTRLSKEMSELCKLLNVYNRKYHKDVYESLLKALEPLSNFLKSNTRLCLFEETYPNPQERYKAEFKEQALEEAFCVDMQNCLRILYDVEKDPDKKIIANPNVRKIFFKLKYKDWDKNPIERFYLKPLKYSFIKMRTNLFKLHSYGIDYWRIPLSNNQVFLKDVKEVINAELISENLLADYLWKDQLNFIYQVVGIIIKSPGAEKVKKKDETMLGISIPELVVFKTLQEMRRILDKKIEDSRDIAAEDPTSYTAFIKNSEPLENSQLQQSQLQNSQLATSTLKVSKSQQLDGAKSPLKSKKTLVQLASEEDEEKKKQEEAELKKYGRFWLWQNYVEEQDRALFEQGAEMLLRIHEAIQQDIQDFIITEGLVPKYKDQASKIQNKDQIKKDKDRLHELRLEANNQMEINNIRPPLLWNHPDILETQEVKHQFRANSMPKTCYIDGRVNELLDLVIELARKLQSFKPAVWEELITRVIDCYNDEYNPKPTFHLQMKTVVVEEEEKLDS